MPLAHLHDPLVLVVSALAVYRITRLLVADQVLAAPREAVQRWAGGTAQRRSRPALAYFVTCPWCVSIWVAAGWLLLLLFGSLLLILCIAVPLACSAAAGLLSSWE